MNYNHVLVKFVSLAILLLFGYIQAAQAHDGFRYLMDSVVPLTPSYPSANKVQSSTKNKSVTKSSNVDWGPYMRELQRRIKMNWDPPEDNENKRVVLRFKIAKDGRLLSNSVVKSSGIAKTDKAAIDAVSLSSPFRPLPADFKGESIDIQFVFDYNVIGASSY